MFPQPILAAAKALVTNAASAGLRIAFAESCTGGLMAGAVTEIPGASACFERGFVVYTARAKRELLGVPPELLLRHGEVSEEVARAMAEGALRHAGVHLAAACTGIAGPGGGSPEKPVGLVHLAAAREGQTTLHAECHFGNIGRGQVRLKAVEAGLKLLLQIL
jgi:nicotinamide-nucleotide amidase